MFYDWVIYFIFVCSAVKKKHRQSLVGSIGGDVASVLKSRYYNSLDFFKKKKLIIKSWE
jgi:hypothetical protein